MNTPKNLWGELPLAIITRTPVVILREQANQLTELTNGLLEGEVTTHELSGEKPFFYKLNIVAPALDGYRALVAFIMHSITLYPVILVDEINPNKSYECKDEDVFIAAIGEVLSSPGVHKLISALLSQSKSEEAF